MCLRQHAYRALSPQQTHVFQQAMMVKYPQQQSEPCNAHGFAQDLDRVGDKFQGRDQRDEIELLILKGKCSRIPQEVARAIAQTRLFQHGGRGIQADDVEPLPGEPASKVTGSTANLKQAGCTGKALQLPVEQRLLLLRCEAAEPLLVPLFVVACHTLIEQGSSRAICTYLLSPPFPVSVL